MSDTDPQPRREAAFFSTVRGWGITRGAHGILGGVVEGVGERIGLARVPARLIAVVLLVLVFPLFLLAYAAAWALLPDASGRIIAQDFGRGTPNVGALIGIGILAIVALNTVPNAWPGGSDRWWLPSGLLWAFVPLVALVGVVVVVITLVSRSHSGGIEPRATAAPPRRGNAAEPRATAAGAERAKPAAPPEAPTASAPVPVVARPPRPRTPGPGSAVYLLILSSSILAAAVIWWLDRVGRLDAHPVVAWFAAMIVILGAGIVLVGALGRRVGFLGFLTTILVLGWVASLTALPRVGEWVRDGVTVTIDGVRHTIGDDRGWFHTGTDGVSCGSYTASAADGVSPGAAEVAVATAPTTVTVSDSDTIVTIPAGASIAVRGSVPVTGSISWAEEDVTCRFDRARGDLYSVLRVGEIVTIDITSTTSTVVIEER